MRYYFFLYAAIVIFIISMGTIVSIEISPRGLVLHIGLFIVGLFISFLFFKMRSKTWKELVLNFKQDLKLDGDYI